MELILVCATMMRRMSSRYSNSFIIAISLNKRINSIEIEISMNYFEEVERRRYRSNDRDLDRDFLYKTELKNPKRDGKTPIHDLNQSIDNVVDFLSVCFSNIEQSFDDYEELFHSLVLSLTTNENLHLKTKHSILEHLLMIENLQNHTMHYVLEVSIEDRVLLIELLIYFDH